MDRTFGLPFLALITFAFICASVQSSTLESDVYVLRALKRSIDPITIRSNTYLRSWNFSLDPCESAGGFIGILCTVPADNSSKRISAIDLDPAGYDGFLTNLIGDLTELTDFNIASNQFRGPIPDSVGNLQKLTRLSLGDNIFTGVMPPGIAGLRRLQVLDLSRNHLSGRIPANASAMRRLIRLKFSGNSFSGKIPDLSGLWQLTTLDLSDNQFYGDLPNLPASLTHLDVSKNALSGHLSPLTTLMRLKWMDISQNKFTGKINQQFLVHKSMTHFNASINSLGYIEPFPFIEEHTQLQVLDAHRNQLQGRLPEELPALQDLSWLDLSHNSFSGVVPASYGQKEGHPWSHLFLQDNFLAGNLPTSLSNNRSVLKGSFAGNCLRCPATTILCRGAQRPKAECARHKNGNEPAV